MSLSNLRSNYVYGADYYAERNYFIKIVENPQLLQNGTHNGIHSPGNAQLPTIGYGYDLSQRSWAEINAFLPAAMGGALTPAQQDAMYLIELYKGGTTVTVDLGAQTVSRALTDDDILDGAAGSDAEVVISLDGGGERRIAFSSLSTLQLTEAQASSLLNWVMVENGPTSGPDFPEKGVDAYSEDELTNLSIPQSRERAALVSLAFVGGPDLIGPSLRAAISADDRAEAWYEIRYNSNNGSPQFRNGLAKRYFATSEVFSLYDSDGPNLADAKEIFAMYARHAVAAGANGSGQSIDQYETTYSERIATANNDYGLTGTDIVEDRRETFGQAFDVIFEEFNASGVFSEAAEILVDPSRDKDGNYDASKITGLEAAPVLLIGEGGNDTLTGWSKGDLIIGDYGNASDRDASKEGKDKLFGGDGNDLLFGDGGDDELHGGDGNDILIGGGGADKLYGDDDTEIDILTGGAGADEFYVGAGDIIADFDVGDKIYANGALLTGGEVFTQWLYDDSDDAMKIGLPFAAEGGLAIGVVEPGATGGGLAIMGEGMIAPILVFGRNAATAEDFESEPIVVGVDSPPGAPHDDTWERRQYINQDDSLRFTAWEGRDDAGQWDGPFANVPGYASQAYDWQAAGEIPGSFDQEGNWSFATSARDLLGQYGYDLGSHTWNEQNLLSIWGVEAGANGDDQGALQNPDGPNNTGGNGSPSLPGQPVQQAAAAVAGAGSLISPLVLDLDGNGLELINLTDSKAYFDLDENGFAQRTGWVTGGDGLLAIDANQNGQIDDINELFGAPEPYGKATTNGFDALAALDSNSDGKIESSDAKFGDLRVWIDGDEDGLTDAGELKTLSEVGIESVSLSETENVSQSEGNTISHTAEFNKVGGGTGAIADVWFANSNLETYDVRSATVDAAIMALPALRGYGEVAGLRLSMSRDPYLFKQVQELSFWGGAHEEPVPSDLLARIENIALLWMIGDGEIGDRGENIDAAHLVALERFTGQSFFQSTGPEGPNPGPNAAAALDAAWGQLVLSIGARILVQSLLKPAFDGVAYDWGTDSFDGTLDAADAVTALLALAPTGADANAYAFWKLAVFALDEAAEDLGILPAEYDDDLADALSNAGFDLSLAELREANVRQGGGTIIAADDDVMVFGSAEADDIRTGAGDDKIIGGAGNDHLNGQVGSDTYVFGKDGGHDVITDIDADPLSTDTFLFSAGILPSDVLVSRSGDDLVIRLAGPIQKRQSRVSSWIPITALRRSNSPTARSGAAPSSKACRSSAPPPPISSAAPITTTSSTAGPAPTK